MSINAPTNFLVNIAEEYKYLIRKDFLQEIEEENKLRFRKQNRFKEAKSLVFVYGINIVVINPNLDLDLNETYKKNLENNPISNSSTTYSSNSSLCKLNSDYDYFKHKEDKKKQKKEKKEEDTNESSRKNFYSRDTLEHVESPLPLFIEKDKEIKYNFPQIYYNYQQKESSLENELYNPLDFEDKNYLNYVSIIQKKKMNRLSKTYEKKYHRNSILKVIREKNEEIN